MDDAFPLVDNGCKKYEGRKEVSKSKGNEHEHRLVRFFVHNLRCTKMIFWFSLRWGKGKNTYRLDQADRALWLTISKPHAGRGAYTFIITVLDIKL